MNEDINFEDAMKQLESIANEVRKRKSNIRRICEKIRRGYEFV